MIDSLLGERVGEPQVRSPAYRLLEGDVISFGYVVFGLVSHSYSSTTFLLESYSHLLSLFLPITRFPAVIRYTVQCTDEESMQRIEEIVKEVQGIELLTKTMDLRSHLFLTEGKFAFIDKK